MSGLDEMLERTIDRDCAHRNLVRFLTSADGAPPAIVEAPALLRFDCGHVRPVNVWFEPGDSFFCVLCGPRTVSGLELLPEPEEFPSIDSLRHLPEIPISDVVPTRKGIEPFTA